MIQLQNLRLSYGKDPICVIDDLCLDVSSGETLVLLGSSGCGKTTLLKMINGLVTPDSGQILIDGSNITSYSKTDLCRSMGYVFQQASLFPHFTIQKNITIVLKLQGKPIKQRQQRAHELLELVGMDPAIFSHRYPDELSGGEQQRIGVARALAADPDYLLMDEPFGALDAITRSELQQAILQLKQQLHKTIVFVTHDIAEAFYLADRIAIMNNGKIEQVDTPKMLSEQPGSDFVKDLLRMLPV